MHAGIPPPGVDPPGADLPSTRHPPGAEHAGRYGQRGHTGKSFQQRNEKREITM